MATACLFCSAKMAAVWCMVILGFAMAAVRVHCQSTDTLGFVSIDCGIAAGSTYVDPTTTIPYVSDAPYTDAGVNQNISAAYLTNFMGRRYFNVRSFPNGTRNCYTINSITPNSKYLIRASFFYGNYDGLGSQSRLFDLYLGVNLWKTINITDPGSASRTDVITVAASDSFSVCLVNTGHGTPFISGLDVRPLKEILYPAVNASRSLVLSLRLNMGPTDTFIRYPDDPHDRIWDPFTNIPFWAEISTNSTVENIIDDKFEAPSTVMQTAVIPVNSTKLMMSWEPEPGDINEYYAVMHFSEFLTLTGNMSRQFYVYLNGHLWYAKPFTPEYLYSDAIYSTNPTEGDQQYNVTIQALDNSTLPPILNAMEVYSRMSDVNVPSDAGDVDAMMAVKAWYKIKRNWMGDPCSPKALAWDGLNCSSNLSNPPRITTLNLSSSGLTGEIATSFASLTAIQILDLSHNNLTGTIPAILAQLPSLKILDLTNNNLDGSIPSPLLTKAQNGELTLRIESNPYLCGNGTSCEITTKKKKKLPTPIIVIICVASLLLLLLLLVVVSIIWRLRKPPSSGKGNSVEPQREETPKRVEHQDGRLQLENRQFTYMELKSMTNNFERVIGKGGFGTVYYGCLEDGTQVAVKMRSQSSSQGTKEFLAEAQHLTRVHHRNLVSMVGYCKDEPYLALVYEFMAQGTLQDHLRGRAGGGRALTWRQRLRIAVQAAQGLEYLHKGCKPPLVHRDVKTGNILLSESLEAKIADFGLSKAFQSEIDNSHVSTVVMGTPGYLDPEYYATNQLSEKSDVYSFGVVLLELLTGQPPVITAAGKAHIAHWVRQRLARGNIEDVVDGRLQGESDVNSMWKCADVALRCASPVAHQRPDMAEVVAQLKESLQLENPYDSSRTENLHAEASDVSQNSALEMEGVQLCP